MIKNLLIKILMFYRKNLSSVIKSNCIFTPTCSEYAIEAYKKHNVLYASLLIIWRLLRCNSLNKGGYDPVPDKKSNKKWVL
ncbi:MAG: membrane protein insertion efficiency factor YidD [Clostridia bacterium]|jgi:putative membrane protein insertion efficiency factor|nr:membrane protein insertion efficiency factor YidD [Clostridia bacterium]